MKGVAAVATMWLAGCADIPQGMTPDRGLPPSSAVASVQMSVAVASVAVGGTLQLAASPRTITGAGTAARSVLWSSDASAVATVTQNALVTGMSAGTTNIKVTMDGHVGMTTVTVTPSPGGR